MGRAPRRHARFHVAFAVQIQTATFGRGVPLPRHTGGDVHQPINKEKRLPCPVPPDHFDQAARRDEIGNAPRRVRHRHDGLVRERQQAAAHRGAPVRRDIPQRLRDGRRQRIARVILVDGREELAIVPVGCVHNAPALRTVGAVPDNGQGQGQQAIRHRVLQWLAAKR